MDVSGLWPLWPLQLFFLFFYSVWFAMSSVSQKCAAKSAGTNKKKPGPSGNFTGFRLEFLLGKFEEYKETVANKKTRLWWEPLLTEFWTRVEWRKPLNEETDVEHFINASVPQDDELTMSKDELSDKAETVKTVTHVSVIYGSIYIR